MLFSETGFEQYALYTVDPASGLARVEKGERIYDVPTLVRYVEAELELSRACAPTW